MADPPKFRRPPTRPPPIPRIFAPKPAKTDVVPIPRAISDDMGDEPQAYGDETTKNDEAPDAGQLVERMLDLVASEAEALLEGDEDRLADLNVRTALAAWDGLHQPEEAMRYLELAESHPLALRLRLSAALGTGDEAALTAAVPKIGAPTALLALDLAEAWLWRFRRADLAAPLADRALLGADPRWRTEAVELAALAHAANGNWKRVVEIRRSAVAKTSPPEEVAAAAALLLDRGNDPVAALALCWIAIERMDEDPNERDTAPSPVITRGGWLRLIDVAIAAASRGADPRRLELLDRRADLLKDLPGGAHELGGAHRIARYGAALAAMAGNDPQAALAARRILVQTEARELIAVHGWRAFELAALVGETPSADLAHAVVAAAETPIAERQLDLIDLAEGTSALTVSRLERRGGYAVRWAAAVAEQLANYPRAVELWKRALKNGLGTEPDHLVRLLRGSGSLRAQS